MSEIAQIVLITAMILFAADSFYWAVKKHIAATIWTMGIALILGIILF